MSTKKTSIDPKTARKRIEDLAEVFSLALTYAQVKRATYLSNGARETDGEHAISLAMIATAYALEYHPSLDPYKVFFYAVMHDIDEFLYGDTPTLRATVATFALKDAEEAEAAERRAEILRKFPKLNQMIDELSDMAKPENAFGKAFDKLAPGYTHSANKGKSLKEDFGIYSYEDILQSTSLTDEKMRVYAANFPDVIEMRQQMHRKVAQDAFGEK